MRRLVKKSKAERVRVPFGLDSNGNPDRFRAERGLLLQRLYILGLPTADLRKAVGLVETAVDIMAACRVVKLYGSETEWAQVWRDNPANLSRNRQALGWNKAEVPACLYSTAEPRTEPPKPARLATLSAALKTRHSKRVRRLPVSERRFLKTVSFHK